MSPGPYDQNHPPPPRPGFEIPHQARAEIDAAIAEMREARENAPRPVVAPTVITGRTTPSELAMRAELAEMRTDASRRDPRFPPPTRLGLSDTERANIDAIRAELGWRQVEATPRRLGPIPYGRALAALARWLQRRAWTTTTVIDDDP